MTPDELRTLADAIVYRDSLAIARVADYLRALADAQPVAPAVPAGWKPVPVEPTEAMREAADHDTTYYGHVATNNYKAMLAAAPAVPQAETKREPNPDEVICPACNHQFRAIPENVQAQLWAKREPLSDEQIASVCVSYRHDFGLLSDDEQAGLMLEARAWERAFRKEWQR
ncbi:MAG: hypothetical protein OZ924_18385 [Burkholderiaceae bacterium]|nr:hypothetical protein [Burkholderiaceae bacterium]